MLFPQDPNSTWEDISYNMIINFCDKGTYVFFKQKGNHLFIETIDGTVDIVFTGEVPQLEFDNFCKDQLVLKVV